MSRRILKSKSIFYDWRVNYLIGQENIIGWSAYCGRYPRKSFRYGQERVLKN